VAICLWREGTIKSVAGAIDHKNSGLIAPTYICVTNTTIIHFQLIVEEIPGPECEWEAENIKLSKETLNPCAWIE